MAVERKAENTVMNPGFFNGASDVVKMIHDMGAAFQKKSDQLEQDMLDIDGRTYYWNRNTNRWEELKVSLPDDEPVPGTIKFFTLDGVIDYIRENVEGLIPDHDSGERLILQVVDETTVALMSKPSTHHKERHAIIKCEAHVPRICFGSYISTDDFNTMLLSNFICTPAREELFKVVKSLTNEQSMNTADDGVSQVVTVKQGVSLASNCQFKNPVPLAPMRTFTEIEQPESNFTLRVNEKANVALFEADGGAWKNEAVARVKEYLKKNLSEYPVVVMA